MVSHTGCLGKGNVYTTMVDLFALISLQLCCNLLSVGSCHISFCTEDILPDQVCKRVFIVL